MTSTRALKVTRLKPFIRFLFMLSGLCGLVYEVAWSKYLTLFLGGTAYSFMIVTATFMGGLALGSYYWGAVADKSGRNVLRLYGILETAIGAYCLLYPWLIGLAEKLFIAFGSRVFDNSASGHQGMLLLIKFVLSFLTLILPTFFMGGTLPLLTKYLTRHIAASGREVATLYYLNSIGAVMGAILAGFFLIRMFSLDWAVFIAAVLNLGIGAAVFLVSGKVEDVRAEPAPDVAHPEKEPVRIYPPRTVRLAFAAAGISGFIAMIYELTWTRLLMNILGSSTYAFSLMLVAFISGIALGSWMVSTLISGRVKQLVVLLGFCQIGTAGAMILMLPFYERLPYYLLLTVRWLTNTPEHFPYFLGCEFLLSFLVMIVPTSLSGMSLPVAGRIASNDLRLLGRSVGNIFSINTVGTVLGAVVTGLILIPQLGVKTSIELGVGLNAVLGLAILFLDGTLRRAWRVGLAACLALMAMMYRVAYPAWDPYIETSGIYRFLYDSVARMKYTSFEEFKNSVSRDRKCLWYKEGLNANVGVFAGTFSDTVQKILMINGKSDASTIADLPTQVLLAQIPLVLLPDTGDALVIGLGSGVTCGSALTHPIRSLECVEIASEVVECDSFFAEENRHALSNPRLSLYIDDAITYLKVRNKQFNYIISEPTNPWIAGVGTLFSAEFFNLCKEHLRRPGGALVQWFHMYEMDDATFRLILRTMTRTFPYISIWKISEGDILVMAAADPPEFDFGQMQRKVVEPAIANDLSRISIRDLPTLLSTQVFGYGPTGALVGSGEINSEKKPLLEFMAPVAFYSDAHVQLIDSIDERFSSRAGGLLLAGYQTVWPLSSQNFLNMADFRKQIYGGDQQLIYPSLKKCLELDSTNVSALEELLEVTLTQERLEEHWSTLRKLTRLSPRRVDEYLARMIPAKDTYDSSTVDYLTGVAFAMAEAGAYESAAELWDNIAGMQQQGKIPYGADFEVAAAVYAAQNYIQAGRSEAANSFIDLVATLDPQNKSLPSLKQALHNKLAAHAKIIRRKAE